MKFTTFSWGVTKGVSMYGWTSHSLQTTLVCRIPLRHRSQVTVGLKRCDVVFDTVCDLGPTQGSGGDSIHGRNDTKEH